MQIFLRLPALLTLLALGACNAEQPDAYGNFESREVVVSAEAAGTLIRFDAEEGDEISAGVMVAQVDTIQMALQAAELVLQEESAGLRAVEAAAQVRSLEAQLATSQTDLERVQRLFDREAATAGDLNRLEGSVTSLQAQIDGARARVRLARQEEAIVASRTEQLRDRIRRATVINPIGGTVLTTLVEAGEVVQAGRPLYTIAPLDTLTLRAYVTGNQLASLRVGESVRVQFDSGSGAIESRDGRLTWVASQAEFTPTPIQTRDERVDQVYAVKVRVPNLDRRLKIGMPAELVLNSAGEAGAP